MSDISDSSDKEIYGEKDEDFNVEDYQDDIESDESFNECLNDDNAAKNSEEEEVGPSTGGQDEEYNDYIGPCLPGGHHFDRKLVCVRYPANVVNEEKAIETLGGLAEISKAIDTKNRRLELRFRPDDGYCKPANGDRYQTCGFLLRIRIKKSRREKIEKISHSKSDVKVENFSSQKNEDNYSTNNVKEECIEELTDKIVNCSVDSQTPVPENNQTSEKLKPPTFDRDKYENLSEDVEYELPKLRVLGRVDSEYRFISLCDYQFLPITKNKADPTKDECIYESIYPVGIPPYSWMKEEVPYFLPPAAFSRMDTVQQYVPKSESSRLSDQFVIGKTRKRRSGFSNFINFNTPYVPTDPPKGIEFAMKVKFLQTTHLATMRKAFEERPIWSKTALMYITRYSNEQLKILLPTVAYYFMTGPWRITWVRLGYDPRKDPEARIYQTLDYRLKAMHGLHNEIACKRNYAEYTLPNKCGTAKAQPMVLMSNRPRIDKKHKVMDDNVYIYRPGTIPPSRQMFYQYCDLYVPEIQEMFDKYVGPPPGTPCHEKLGWLPVGFDDLCREIINKQVRTELRKIMNIPENHPTQLPRKRKMEPTGKVPKRKNNREKENEKRRKQKAAANQLQQQPQPAAMSIIEDEDLMQSDEDDWEDIIDDDELNDIGEDYEAEMENYDDFVENEVDNDN